MTRSCPFSPGRQRAAFRCPGSVVLALIGSLVCAVMLGACSPARHGGGEYPEVKEEGTIERVWPATEGLFRHAVRITLPGAATPLAIDGVMHLTPGREGPTIRVVCLGPLGMTLCDMTIDPKESRTDVLHPSLRRVPHLERSLALCVRSVWINSLPVMGLAATPLREQREDTLLEHRLTPEGDRLTTAYGIGTGREKPLWSVRSSPGPAHPATILFTSHTPEYAVQIRLIAKGKHP